MRDKMETPSAPPLWAKVDGDLHVAGGVIPVVTATPVEVSEKSSLLNGSKELNDHSTPVTTVQSVNVNLIRYAIFAIALIGMIQILIAVSISTYVDPPDSLIVLMVTAAVMTIASTVPSTGISFEGFRNRGIVSCICALISVVCISFLHRDYGLLETCVTILPRVSALKLFGTDNYAEDALACVSRFSKHIGDCACSSAKVSCAVVAVAGSCSQLTGAVSVLIRSLFIFSFAAFVVSFVFLVSFMFFVSRSQFPIVEHSDQLFVKSSVSGYGSVDGSATRGPPPPFPSFTQHFVAQQPTIHHDHHPVEYYRSSDYHYPVHDHHPVEDHHLMSSIAHQLFAEPPHVSTRHDHHVDIVEPRAHHYHHR